MRQCDKISTALTTALAMMASVADARAVATMM